MNCMHTNISVKSGGEEKEHFWKMVHLSTDLLPKEKPRYLMGVGFAADLVVCCALGVDMFDCVFPTRTAVSFYDSAVQYILSNADLSCRNLSLFVNTIHLINYIICGKQFKVF